jgi:hypothetical protein
MDTLLSKIKASRDIRETTLNIYKNMLNRLADKLDVDFSMDMFETKKSEILEYLSTLSNSVKKKMIASIMVAISPEKNKPLEKYSSLYNTLKLMLNKENGIYLESVSNNKKSDKDEKNWTTMNELHKVRERLLKHIKAKGYDLKKDKGVESKKDFFLIQKYLIASLYTLLPPRRLIYSDMKIVNKKEFDALSEKEKEDDAYLVNVNKSRKYFYYGKEADKSSTEEAVKIDVPKSLNNLLNFWTGINKKDYLLLNNQGQKLSKNNLSKEVRSIFSNKSKNISVNLIRKIYISERFADVNKEKKEIAEQMNHSVNVADNFYMKK